MKIKSQTLILLAVFISIISQAPLFRESFGISTQNLMLPFWIVGLFWTLFQNRTIYLGKSRMIYIQFFFIFIGIIFLEIFCEVSYYTAFTRTIILAFMMFFIGLQTKNMLYDDWFKKLAYVYVGASLFLAIDIYIKYFLGHNFNTISYVYRAKNSAGQILLTSIIFILFLLYDKNKIFFKIILIFFFLFEIIIMRSRATMLSFLFIPITFLKGPLVKFKYKIEFIFLIIVGLIYFYINQSSGNLLISNLLFNSYKKISLETLDVNAISSNRFDMIKDVPEKLLGKELYGLGDLFYVDNVFINAIGNYGIIIGGMVCLLVISPLFYVEKYSKYFFKGIKKTCIQLITWIYVFNGFFEGWAPFGPGSKCFLLWFVLGMVLSMREKVRVDYCEK